MAKLSAHLSVFVCLSFLVGCDHATKAFAKAELDGGGVRELVRGALDFRYVENTDIAFNLLRWVPENIRAPALLILGAIAVSRWGPVLRGRAEPDAAALSGHAGAIGNNRSPGARLRGDLAC